MVTLKRLSNERLRKVLIEVYNKYYKNLKNTNYEEIRELCLSISYFGDLSNQRLSKIMRELNLIEKTIYDGYNRIIEVILK